jgi:hypothetical protein
LVTLQFAPRQPHLNGKKHNNKQANKDVVLCQLRRQAGSWGTLLQRLWQASSGALVLPVREAHRRQGAQRWYAPLFRLFLFYIFWLSVALAGRAADGEPTCEKCNAEMDAAIGQALTNAQSEHSKYGGFLDRKYEPACFRAGLSTSHPS